MQEKALIEWVILKDFNELTDNRWQDYAAACLDSNYAHLIVDKDAPTNDELKKILMLNNLAKLATLVIQYRNGGK